MTVRKCAFTLFLFLLAFSLPQSLQISPIDSGSHFYPVASKGLNASDHLFIVNDYSWSRDEQLLVQSLQGVCARTAPAIHRNRSQGSSGALTNAAPLWLEKLQDLGLVKRVTKVESPAELLSLLQKCVTGYVKYDSSQPNVALTAASGLDANVIVVTEATEKLLHEHGLKMEMDVRNMTVPQVVADLGGNGRFSQHIASMQDPNKSNYLADFTLFSRAIGFYAANMSDTVVSQVLSRMDLPAAVFGWGPSEEAMVQMTSSYGQIVHAADWALNLATLTNYHFPNVRDLLPSPKDHLSSRNRGDGHCSQQDLSVHTVTFLMTDGDNIQWLLSDFATSRSWWGSHLRGQVPIGWTLSPALYSLAPVVMHHLYSTATSNDSFVAAPSGLGYLYPDLTIESPGGKEKLKQFSDMTTSYMAATGMRLLNVLGWRYSQDAANLLVELHERTNVKKDTTGRGHGLRGDISGIEGVLWLSKEGEEHGEIYETPAGVPVILPRYQLAWWADNVTTLVDKLREMPKDVTTPMGYSMVPVFVWDYGVPDVVVAVEKLNAIGGFDVVSPTEFVDRISKWLQADEKGCRAPNV